VRLMFKGFALFFSAAMLAGAAWAQPSLKMMIPANPGGGWDQAGRNLAAAMQSAKLVSGVQFENKGGAAGAIGLAQFVNSTKGDPNAVMIGGITMIGGVVMNNQPSLSAQVTPIARLTYDWEVIVVPANSPHKSMADLVKAFKENPGKVSWGGGSAGGTDHILIGLVAKAVAVDPAKVNYVAFKGGGEAVTAILGGHVTAGVSGIGEFLDHIKAGKMRALAVSSPAASDGIPSLKEQGIDVELGNWRGIFGAPGITAQQRATLIEMVKKATATPTWAATVEKLGWVPAYLAGDDYSKFIDDETRRVREILTSLGIGKK
jgi:putative tricarboxylic transport membrane protein